MSMVPQSPQKVSAPERKRRVLFLVPSLRGGGVERVAVTLLNHMDASRFEMHLGLLELSGPYLSQVPKEVTVHDLRVRRVRYALPGIVRLIRRLRPDAVLTMMRELSLSVSFARWLLPPGLRVLAQVTNTPTGQVKDKGGVPGVPKWLYRRLYERADKIIGVADFVLTDLNEHFGVSRKNMVRIYNPVDIESIRKMASSGPSPYRGPGPHLVSVARLTPQKAHDMMLEAMQVVLAAIPEARLTLVGEGPLEQQLKQQAERAGISEAVHFAGFQTNPYPYIRHADFLVLSSHYEGLPVVILESLALGTPVVAADCPGAVREVLASLVPKAAWLAPPEDPQELAKAIVNAWSARRGAPRSLEELDQFARPFSVEKIVREYEELLAS